MVQKDEGGVAGARLGELPATLPRGGGILVVLRPLPEIEELRRQVHEVAGVDESLGATERDCRVAGRMAGRRDETDALRDRSLVLVEL